MDPDPDPRKEIEVDPDLERGLKWNRIRPNAVDPGGSGSETLVKVSATRPWLYFWSLTSGKLKIKFCKIYIQSLWLLRYIYETQLYMCITAHLNTVSLHRMIMKYMHRNLNETLYLVKTVWFEFRDDEIWHISTGDPFSKLSWNELLLVLFYVIFQMRLSDSFGSITSLGFG